MHLSTEKIQEFSDLIEEKLSPLNTLNQNKTWLRLSMEEALLRYKDSLGESAEFSYQIKKRFSTLLVEITVQGRQLDVLHPGGEDGIGTNMMDALFSRGDYQLLYSYKNGKNIISISMPYSRSKVKIPGSPSIHAIIIAIFVGILMRYFLPDTTMLVDDYISPVYSTLMSCLKGLMEPVIFLSLIIGICALDDLRTLSTIGKKSILSFLKLSTAMFLLATGVCFLTFPSSGITTHGFNPADILELLLTSIPTNIIGPFYEGNMIQIVVLGFISGIVILLLGEKAASIRQLFLETKFFFFSILELFVKILPFVIFLSVLKVILTMSFSDSAIVWKIIVVDQALVAVIALIGMIVTSIMVKMPLSLLAKKVLPLFNISFATGSSTAAIPEFYKRLPQDFGIDEKYANYWIPLSNSFFSPSTIVALIVYAFFSAQTQNVGISLNWIIILYIMVIQIGMATPRIPGGIIASCTILFSQLGLTTDQLGIIMAANVIVLYFDTAVAAISRCCCAIRVAYKQNCIDLDKLRS